MVLWEAIIVVVMPRRKSFVDCIAKHLVEKHVFKVAAVDI